MVTIEVKTETGKILDRRTFKLPLLAAEWFEKARELYGNRITVYFENRDVVSR